jgi:hypothetical protein
MAMAGFESTISGCPTSGTNKTPCFGGVPRFKISSSILRFVISAVLNVLATFAADSIRPIVGGQLEKFASGGHGINLITLRLILLPDSCIYSDPVYFPGLAPVI